jgi:hypothetical protein
MKKQNSSFFLLLAFLAACAPAVPTQTGTRAPATQAPPSADRLQEAASRFAATITAADLSKHLHILASDAFEGRDTGSKGQKMAAEYIANQFKEFGLQGPVPNSSQPYYQPFELTQARWGEVYITADDRRYDFLKDFYVHVQSTSPYEQEQEVDLVFAGYGIEDATYSDYRNLDVAGKAVIVLAGEPTGKNGRSLIDPSYAQSTWATDYRKKATLALEKGARSIFIVAGGTGAEFSQLVERIQHVSERPVLKSSGAIPTRVATFVVSPELGARLLNTDAKGLQQYRQRVSNAGKAVASPFRPERQVRVKAERVFDPIPTENVLGLVEGTDKKDEIVVVTAHYDHVGVEGGEIFNGADDDGSGTVAVIELAQAFAQAKQAGFGPRRSILFMTVSAEEKGLLGSEYYTQNPIFPLENTVVNLNIDMIGRLDQKYSDNPNYVYVIGSDKLSSALHQINEEANKKYTNLELDYTYNDPDDPNRFYYRSDHYNFAKNQIPVIFYFNGVHEDYHRPTDTVDKILFEKMEKIARLVFYTTWELANREERIVVDSNKR